MTKSKDALAALLLTLSVVSSAFAAPESGASIQGTARVQEVRAPQGRTMGSRADEARYAAKEAASAEAKNYRAGDVIVISATALVIILLVILIIVLI
jgi:hypothetical protein